jgi:hypothetical protein
MTASATQYSPARLEMPGVCKIPRYDPDLGVQLYAKETINTPDRAFGLGEIVMVPEMDDVWRRMTDLEEVWKIIQRNAGKRSHLGMTGQFVRVDWPAKTLLVERTESDFLPTYNNLDEETAEYVQRLRLREGIAWLHTAVPSFFPCADFEISVLPAEDGEDRMLALKIYDALPVAGFHEKRHAICKAMLKAGHKHLYDVISIFQRRVSAGGRQALSWYCKVSAE